MSRFEPGEVYAYFYLWSRQHWAGEESGRKARPSSLVFRSPRSPAELYLFPLTTKKPSHSRQAVEIPSSERALCGLTEPCWLIIDEFNVTLESRTYDFQSLEPVGRFSPRFVKMLAARIAVAIEAGLVSAVKRN